MGLAKTSIRFLAWQHRRRAFSGPVLLLGRQHVYATLDEVNELLREEGLTPQPVPGPDRVTNIAAWEEGRRLGYTTDRAVFQAISGLEVVALDNFGSEGAEVVHDLNLCLPGELKGKFGLIVDSGTAEHVFNCGQVLANIRDGLKPGGECLHISPANSYLNHGFYQFSPTWFWDYYGINEFEEIECYVVQQGVWPFVNQSRWLVYEFPRGSGGAIFSSHKLLAVAFRGRKPRRDLPPRTPSQGQFEGGANAGRTSMIPGAASGWRPVKTVLVAGVRRWPRFARLFLKAMRLERSCEPWRLKLVKKL
jgi:SAM-dependent methyltransferase